ncbi:DUF4268 domain-containing protein [Dehalococcoides sp. THU3]|uniref:DUF4268 domain-containing protein n=1 Tax=Dehalococcoides TaxID=61434 RepID=UPI00321848B4
MGNELQSLSVLFQNRLFRIPDYQRGYAWKHEQLVDFWEDLLNLHQDRYHYTGLLSLKAVNRKDTHLWNEDVWLLDIGYKPFHVVDGQQRLTTFSILMHEIVAFINDLADNNDKPDEEIFLGYESLKDIKAKYVLRKRPPHNLVTTYLFGYETDNPSSDYLKYKVFEEPFGGAVFETYYTKNLKYAKSFFADNLGAIYEDEGIEGIERLYKKLTLRLMFNLHEIEDDYDVFVAFETMNNRGKKLTNLELLKNRLIYLTTLFDDKQFDALNKEQLRKNINDAWKEVYYQLGRNQNAPLSDDDFLRAHWITYFQYSRKRGDDYIRFLLNKFSAKNVFEKFTVIVQANGADPLPGFDSSEDDDLADETQESETVMVSKLAPMEISDYVNSLKALAEHWYFSFFPYDSNTISDGEKVWIDKLNRVGIGYFRPLVVAVLATANRTSAKERIKLLKAIERFIFLSFRIGGFNASYKSSDYYNKARDILGGTIELSVVTDDLNKTVNSDMNSQVANFITRTDRRFESGDGFYGWRDLRYFLFEYEHELSTRYNLQKVDWNMFTKVEKDKVTIEHILPQTPTKWYWRNQFRQYTDNEIKLLAASLGNLLPLAQSINSSLQNDSFHDKKNPSSSGRRGYINGSHSEIEVAAEQDWNAHNILTRGLMLLNFMSTRWGITLSDEQKKHLLHIDFVNDGRAVIPELSEENDTQAVKPESQQGTSRVLTDRHHLRYDFWSNFVEYCKSKGRVEDIASRKPNYDDWYDVTVGSRDYHVFFQLVRQKILRIGLYVYRPEDFARLESLKTEIENAYGASLEWYTSREKSTAKRILHSIDTDVHNPDMYPQHFEWLISQFDKLKAALEKIDSTAYQQSVNTSGSAVLTTEMTAVAYDVAKKVYEGALGRGEGKDEIVRMTGMNAGSAGDYVSNFLAMMKGEKYTRTLNEYTTKYFLDHILEDYGPSALQKAVTACKMHADYYATLGHGRLVYVERLVEEYSAL